MTAILLTLCLMVGSEQTNSHAVIPFSKRTDKPVIEKVLATWEVGVDDKVLKVQAVKIAEWNELYIFVDDEDELMLAVPKTNFRYARRVTEQEKMP